MKISIVMVNLNHDKYIWRTLNSIVNQSHNDWELLISDGGSTDRSISIINSFRDPRIKLLPGGDINSREGYEKGVAFATGDVMMHTTSTDGFVDTDWFKLATNALEDDQNLSLVWGGWTQLREGMLSFAVGPHPSRFNETPITLFQNWMQSVGIERTYIPELNFCARSNVYRECLKKQSRFPKLDVILLWHFNFMRHGYLSKFIPTIASFGREHENQLQNQAIQQDYHKWYADLLQEYRNKLITGEIRHQFKSPDGVVLNEIALK
jgi:glycosyltransferase involved in cell wall biosynthesis